jgi:hypothetical protein
MHPKPFPKLYTKDRYFFIANTTPEQCFFQGRAFFQDFFPQYLIVSSSISAPTSAP